MRIITRQISSVLTNLTVIATLSSLTGCPDPEGRYQAFTERKLPFENNDTGGTEGGMEGGMSSEVMRIPNIQSGRFIFGLASNISFEKPMSFIADVVFEFNEDRTEGKLISMMLDPRVCAETDPQQPSAGEGIQYQPTEPPIINEQGSFSADFGEQNVPPSANCISGSFINAVIKLKGSIVSEDAMCGKVSGNLILPFEWDLKNSTFGARRLEGDSIAGVPLPKSCDDVMMMLPTGGTMAGSMAGTEAGTEAGANP